MKRCTLLLTILLIGACQGEAAPADNRQTSPATAPPTSSIRSTQPPPNTPTVETPALIEPTAPLPSATPTVEQATVTPSPSTVPEITETSTPAPGTAVTGIKLSLAVTGSVSKPVFLTHAFDDRLFIVEQSGRILIARDGALIPVPFLDVVDRVGSVGREQGLFSVAFHPQYSNSASPGHGEFFVNYTDKNGDTVISRFRASQDDANRAVPDSEAILLQVAQPFANHNGGQLQFGPDGYLYVGMGDGGSGGDPQGHGQNASTLLGALLRLNVDDEDAGSAYAIPVTNPFVGDENNQDEIWAVGLRNPWRFSFDQVTGDLYLADVGQNAWEEVHFQAADSNGGENYGWNVMEGSHCFRSPGCDMTGLEIPIFEYNHSQGCSVTGGYVYRGQQFPTFRGNYFLSDICSGFIWTVFRESGGTWLTNKVLESGLQISSFGEDFDGELYVLDYGSGQVFRIEP